MITFLHFQSHLCNQQVVVRCSVRPSSHSRVLQASPKHLVDGDVVNLVDCMVVGRHPGALVDVLVLKYTSTYHQVVEHAKVCKHFTVLIHGSQSFSAHNPFSASVVFSDLCIEVASYDEDVSPCSAIQCFLQFIV